MRGKREPRGTAIDVVEAAYRVDVSEQGWLRAVSEAARPVVDRGHGYFAFTFDLRDLSRFVARAVVDLGGPPEVDYVGISLRLNENTPPPVLERLYRDGVALLSDRVQPDSFPPAALAQIRAAMQAMGIADSIGMIARDPSGIGVCATGRLLERERLPARTVREFELATAHVAAGFRLLRHQEPPEAILAADGRVVHAEEPAKPSTAREALRRAARAIDRARGRLRRDDPAEALALWRGLVAGRWSLVDRFESDGRRFVVARRNDPHLPDPRALTLRERQVVSYVAMGHSNKLAAYSLGLSPSSIATHLSSAMRKLGLRTRVSLVATIRAIGTPTSLE